MSREDLGASMVAAPTQSVTITEACFKTFIDYIHQRDLEHIEEQRRLVDRHREDMTRVVKMLINPQNSTTIGAVTNGSLTSSPSTSAPIQTTPPTLPPPFSRNIINLKEASANPEVPFQSTRSPRGALEILTYTCSEKNCHWQGQKEEYDEHLRRIHKLQPHRCLQQGCGRYFPLQ